MDFLSQTHAVVRRGQVRTWLRQLVSPRHRRAVLTGSAALLAVLCVLTAFHMVVPPSASQRPLLTSYPDLAAPPATSTAELSTPQHEAILTTEQGIASAASHSMASMSNSGEIEVIGVETVNSEVADTRIWRPEGVGGTEGPGEGPVEGGTGRELPPIADGDATGMNRTDAEVLASDLRACAAARSDVPLRALRIRHSTERTPDPLPEDIGELGQNPESLAAIDPKTYKFPFRVPEVPGAREYGDVQWCPGSLEPPAEEVPAVDPAYRALFLIGAQKAGTTWLHNALTKHPVAVFGEPMVDNKLNAHRKSGQAKELQFFNAWPALSTEDFLAMWPPEELEAMRNGTSQKFLFDGTPEYLLNAAVPPRLKQMVPQAKIMVVLRDPTDRAFSAWRMRANWGHHCDNDTVPLSQLCVERTFEQTFNAWDNSFARPECRFTTPGSDVSWGECYGCRYNLFRYKTCCELREQGQEGMLPCFGVPRGFSVVDYSAYAPQLAWWLEFFPPEQIFIVTSETLHDETKRIQVLDGLLNFVGLPDAPRFDPAKVNAASAFNGHYANVSPEDVAAKAPVRRFHAPQVRDLHALLARFWPDVDASALAQWPQADEDQSGPL